MRISMTQRCGTDPSARDGERGAALILVAVATIFLGIFASLGLGVFDTKEGPDRERDTRERAERLIDQLASFVQVNGRLPCPANMTAAAGTGNFGREDRNGPGTVCANFTGAVPFQALGLQESDARDGWGRFFTYAVSPVFTDLDGISDGPATNIFNMCRRENLWVDDDVRTLMPAAADGSAGVASAALGPDRNMNPRKAKFCCPDDAGPFAAPATDLQVQGAVNFPLNRSATGNSGGMDTPIIPGVPAGATSEAFAIVLVSHGNNGDGAFIGNGTRNLSGVAAGAEIENADGDNIFTDAPRVLVETALYYDDMIFYRTNWSLYGEINAATCTRPYR